MLIVPGVQIPAMPVAMAIVRDPVAVIAVIPVAWAAVKTLVTAAVGIVVKAGHIIYTNFASMVHFIKQNH